MAHRVRHVGRCGSHNICIVFDTFLPPMLLSNRELLGGARPIGMVLGPPDVAQFHIECVLQIYPSYNHWVAMCFMLLRELSRCVYMRICTFGFVRLDSTGIWWGASLGSRAYCCRVSGHELSWTRKYALNPRHTAHASLLHEMSALIIV